MKKRFVALVVLVMAMLMVTATAMAAQIPMHYDKSDRSVSWGNGNCTGNVDFMVNGINEHPFTAYYDETGRLKTYRIKFSCPSYEGDKGINLLTLIIDYNSSHGFDWVRIEREFVPKKYGDSTKFAFQSFTWFSETKAWVNLDHDAALPEEAFDPAEYWEQLGGFNPSDYEIYGPWTAGTPSDPDDPSTPTTGSATLDNAYGKLAIIDANGNLVDYTGFEKFEGADFYFEHGIIRDDMDGLTLINGTWYNMQQGRFNTADGMVFFEGATFLVRGGVIDETQSGLIEYDGQRFVFSYGQFVSSLYGAWPDPISGRFVYIWAGQFYPITDLVSYDGQIFYFIDGYLATDFVGTVYDFNGTPFNVIYGQVY